MVQAEQRLRTLVITAPERLGDDWIGKLASTPKIEIIDRVGLVSHAIELAQMHRPELVIVDRELVQAESTIRQVLAVAPNALCIAAVPSPDIPVFRRLMAIGARDVLPSPVVFADLYNSLRDVIAAEAERRRSEVLATQNSGARGKLIVVIAPKGGVGTTTIASNVAVAMRQVSGREVMLADFSLQFGDIGVHLNLRSKYSIQDLAALDSEIDDATLKRVISQHESGLHVLLAPSEPDAAAHITSAGVSTVLDHLLQRYAYVIADTWTFLDEVAETLLRRADEVLLVSTPELPTLKNAKRFLEFASRHELTPGRTSIVLNRFPSIEGISLEDVQQHLQHPISANIPSEGQLVTHSINKGVPLVVSHPKSWTAQSMLRLAAKLAGDDINTISLSAEEARQSTVGSKGQRRFWLPIRRPA